MNKLTYSKYWICSAIKYVLFKFINKYRFYRNKRNYAGREKLNTGDTHSWLYNKILSGEPFVAGKFGGSEMCIINGTMAVDAGFYDHIKEGAAENICTLAGFFPKEDSLILAFGHLMLDISRDIDLLNVWYNHMEDCVVHEYAKNARLTAADLLPLTLPEHPWSAALKGKRVLVIHPFAKSIERQYKKREQLFPGTNILPDFELVVLQAVQTIADERDERFKTWFEALEWMYEEAMKIDFDVALIGCGAYGLPLAVKFKRSGKQAIHLGGGTQILFGIKGKRWDEAYPEIRDRFYNEAWVRPLPEEMPEKARKVEDGCYW